MHSLWMSSSEHYFWNRPRRVDVVRLLDGRDAPRRYALLHVDDDQPDGPMHLVAMDRDHPTWTEPEEGRTVYLSVWTVAEGDVGATPDASWEPPPGNPTAWCDLVATEAEARDLYRRYPDR